jgi:hypothetical protein
LGEKVAKTTKEQKKKEKYNINAGTAGIQLENRCLSQKNIHTPRREK